MGLEGMDRRRMMGKLKRERQRAAIMAEILKEQRALLEEGMPVYLGAQPVVTHPLAPIDGVQPLPAPDAADYVSIGRQLMAGGMLPLVDDLGQPGRSERRAKEAAIVDMAVKIQRMEALLHAKEGQLRDLGDTGKCWLKDAGHLKKAVASTLHALGREPRNTGVSVPG
ncbi:hypothetical protein WJX72_004926 [[Myrmecia] bisecta]|uniref:Uncharacterized protein n=1 Tax=[Myrmecia] bisecta TaxID=41462 RepID=A0AAW1QR89_9CHLO